MTPKSWPATWLRRAQAWLVAKMLVPLAVAGIAMSPTRAKADYNPLDGMAGMARFPWVYVAVNAVASDLAAAPLQARLTTQVQGRAARTVVEDPAIDLLRRPNPDYGGYLFRKQLAVDWLLTGNAFIWRTETALWRLHPSDVTPKVGVAGLVTEYVVRDGVMGTGERTLSRDEVIHIRDVAWRNDASSALGHAPMATLHDDLLTEYRSRTLAREQASAGRPDVFISTKGDAVLGPAGAEALVDEYEKAADGKRKAFAFGGEVVVTPLNYSPRDLEFAARSAMTREAVLALFEVTPARAGLADANYGTSRQQARQYIESLQRKSSLWNDAWSRLCRPGVECVHDFSASEALQVARTDQLKRVILWTTIGATAAGAAAYEGLHDAPVPDERLDARAPSTDSRRPEEPQDARRSVVVETPVGQVPDRRRLAASLTRALAESATRWEAIVGDVEPGVSLQLLRRWEAERMFCALDEAGLPPAVSRAVADGHAETAAAVVELLVEAAEPGDRLELAEMDHWSPERADRMAADLVRSLKEAA